MKRFRVLIEADASLEWVLLKSIMLILLYPFYRHLWKADKKRTQKVFKCGSRSLYKDFSDTKLRFAERNYVHTLENPLEKECKIFITMTISSLFLEFISWSQANKTWTLVLMTKVNRYKDWYETTNFDAERINWNDRNFAVLMLIQIWNGFVQINV